MEEEKVPTKVKFDFEVGDSPYLTKEKVYDVVDISSYDDKYGCEFGLVDDVGDSLRCLLKRDAHLEGGNWTIVEYKTK